MSGESDDNPQRFWPEISAIQAMRYAQFSAAALITQDLLLTLDDEIRLVWRGTWGFPALIYLTNRWGVFVQIMILSALNIFLEFGTKSTTLSVDLCQSVNSWSTWSIPITLLSIEALLIVRVVALYQNTKKVSIPLWAMFTSSMVASFALVGIELRSTVAMANMVDYTSWPDGSELIGIASACTFNTSKNIFWAVWLPSLGMETALVILTLMRGVHHWRHGVQTPLLLILVRDGLGYFLVSLFLVVAMPESNPLFHAIVLLLCNLVLSLTSPIQYLVTFNEGQVQDNEHYVVLYDGLLIQLTLCLASVLCSRAAAPSYLSPKLMPLWTDFSSIFGRLPMRGSSKLQSFLLVTVSNSIALDVTL